MEDVAMKMRHGSATKRVGVIMGGSSSEREVSLRSGAAVAQALEAKGHDVVRIALGDAFGPEVGHSLQRARIDVANSRGGRDNITAVLVEIG